LQQQHGSSQNAPPVRQPFVASERSLGASERSNSAQEVEELLGSQGRLQRKFSYQGGWANTTTQAQQQRGKPYICHFAFVHPQNVSKRMHAQHSRRRRAGGPLECLDLEARASETHSRSLKFFSETAQCSDSERRVGIMSIQVLLLLVFYDARVFVEE